VGLAGQFVSAQNCDDDEDLRALLKSSTPIRFDWE